MELSALSALSPLDGRYASKVTELRATCSEYGLIYYRTLVELEWLVALTECTAIKEAASLSSAARDYLKGVLDNFDVADAEAVKKIEQTTNHDVKAIEYFLREKCEGHPELKSLIPFIHFACTSEDINNLSYALMLRDARQDVLVPAITEIINFLSAMASDTASIPMLTRTHGQAATPSTLGKELKNVVMRLELQLERFNAVEILGKCNGAVGNFNAHVSAYPEVDWPAFSKQFIEGLGLAYNSHTTQIEPHDFIAEYLHALMRINTVLIDLDRDVWGYISLQYFKQQTVAGEVGSSTMPHKVNPIDFENSEGNLGLSNALGAHLAAKLPISRWQRDLSDSTVLRNFGSVFGYALLAYKATLKGLKKLSPNNTKLAEDLGAHPEVLAEAIQTVMRRYGIQDAYEQLKAFSRGKQLDQATVTAFIDSIDVPDDARAALKAMTPADYLGLAESLAKA